MNLRYLKTDAQLNPVVLDVLTHLKPFKPAYQNGQAIKSKVSLRMQFLRPVVK